MVWSVKELSDRIIHLNKSTFEYMYLGSQLGAEFLNITIDSIFIYGYDDSTKYDNANELLY